MEAGHIIPVPASFRPYLDAAVVRLGYLKPMLQFAGSDEGIRVSGASPAERDELTRDVMHVLYREKIYAETLPMRRRLVEALTTS